MSSIIQHQRSTEHCPCPCCDPSDKHEALHEACLTTIDQYPCPECKLRFPQQASLEAHQRECLHAHCYNCDVISPTRQLHALHMQSHGTVKVITSSSATQFRCCDCERDFVNEAALASHLRCSKVHKPRGRNEKKGKKKQKKQKQDKGDQQTKCKKCSKTFKNEKALEQHLASVRYNPLSDIKCVADATCKKRFICPSSQLHHLESGGCVSGMTKTKLNLAIAANDPERIITSGGVTTEWLLEDNSSATSVSQHGSPILTPTSSEFSDSYPSSAILTPTSTLSANTNFHSWLTLRPHTRSGRQTCPLCPPSRTREFTPSALQNHLTSSVHAQATMSLPLFVPREVSFHCPRALIDRGDEKKAIKHFSTVSGLVQHLESGACSGGKATFRRVVDYVQEEMESLGFGGLRILS